MTLRYTHKTRCYDRRLHRKRLHYRIRQCSVFKKNNLYSIHTHVNYSCVTPVPITVFGQ